MAGVAGDEGAGERKLVAKKVDQQGARLGQTFDLAIVDFQFDMHLVHLCRLPLSGAFSGASDGSFHHYTRYMSPKIGGPTTIGRRLCGPLRAARGPSEPPCGEGWAG